MQQNQRNIRNVCIVAHVDHGKTTIADCLISTNGIISQRSAGKLRYMDNTAYEQARGITVKSSCISLQHVTQRLPAHLASKGAEATASDRTFLINLIDSPGHMDFSGEVSSALRMTDGCFLVVDAIEGVCIQTRTVLRQAWLEKVRPVLVINKIDKLFSQLQLGPEDAYRQLLRVVEQVNLVLGELWIEQQIVDADSAHAAHIKAKSSEESSDSSDITIDVDASTSGFEESDLNGPKNGQDPNSSENGDGEFEFAPEKGNVIFASAFHGWGFSIDDFVEMYAAKLKMNRKILRKTLWGEYYFNPKTRKIATRRPSANAQTMFASLVLSNIHQIYNAVLGSAEDMANANSHKGYSSLSHRDLTKLERIDKALALNVPPRELKNEDMNTVISSFMGRWLPISTALLDVSISLPDPVEAQQQRISIMWHPSTHDLSPSGIQHQNSLHTALVTADRSQSAPIIAYVSKVFAVPNEQFPRNARIKLEPGHKTLIAMTRLFSGTLKVGDEINILAARFNPAQPEKHIKKAKIPQLWMLMGPDLQPIDEVQAGAVFGIGGEDLGLHELLSESSAPSNDSNLASSSNSIPKSESDTQQTKDTGASTPKLPPISITTADRNAFVSNIVKTATLTNVQGCPVFGSLNRHVNPIVRVAVEPESPSDLASLEAGMWLLHQADAAVHVEVQENGEFIIGALGELHLSRCLELLKDEFARVPIKVSMPIVSFRETVLPGLAIDPNTRASVSTEIVVERSADRQVTIVMRALRLPENITNWLESHTEETRIVQQLRQGIIQQQLQQQQQQQTQGEPSHHDDASQGGIQSSEGGLGTELITKWSESLRAEFNQCESPFWKQQADFVWAMGPHRIGPNLLLNHLPLFATSPYWRSMLDVSELGRLPSAPNPSTFSQLSGKEAELASPYAHETLTWFSILQHLDSAIRSGFQLATRAGPLCEEPLMGVAVQLLDIHISHTPHPLEETPSVSPNAYLLPDPSNLSTTENFDVRRELGIEGRSKNSATTGTPGVQTPSLTLSSERNAEADASSNEEGSDESQLSQLWSSAPNLTGAVISASRSAIRKAFLARPQRLYEALYLAHVQVTAVNMGKAYAVLNRRRSDILSDEVNESSGLTLVIAHVPAAEAFGFSEELVDKSGGAANAQLTFAKWAELDVDPNFVPTTEEELEEFGDNVGGIAPNLARKYVDGVRKRKGLAVNEKLVDGANKQRTLSKKK